MNDAIQVLSCEERKRMVQELLDDRARFLKGLFFAVLLCAPFWIFVAAWVWGFVAKGGRL